MSSRQPREDQRTQLAERIDGLDRVDQVARARALALRIVGLMRRARVQHDRLQRRGAPMLAGEANRASTTDLQIVGEAREEIFVEQDPSVPRRTARVTCAAPSPSG